MGKEEIKKDESMEDEVVKSDESIDEDNPENKEEGNHEEKSKEENSDSENKIDLKTEDDSLREVDKKIGKITLIFIAISIIAIFSFYYMVSESNKVDYIGLTFNKEKFGDILIYTVPLTGNNVNGLPINFKFNIRNNPSKNDVPIEGPIHIIPNTPVYVALNMSSSIYECGSVPMVALGQFLGNMGYEVITGITEKEKAKELEKLYTNCDNNTGSTVLMITESDKTEIVRHPKNSNCYEVRVNNCELGEAVEKVELAILSSLTNKSIN